MAKKNAFFFKKKDCFFVAKNLHVSKKDALFALRNHTHITFKTTNIMNFPLIEFQIITYFEEYWGYTHVSTVEHQEIYNITFENSDGKRIFVFRSINLFKIWVLCKELEALAALAENATQMDVKPYLIRLQGQQEERIEALLDVIEMIEA